MILPSFVLPAFINQCRNESGLDSLEHCFDKRYFLNYPWPVEYQYNSRGYRDKEWPTESNDLENSIWCIGDSFTVGLGSPISHTWPNVLSKTTDSTTINISLDGASNDWISRKVSELITEVVPKNIVIHWSYIHRRERDWQLIDQQWNLLYTQIKKSSWPECARINDFFDLPEHLQREIIQNYTIDSKFLHFIKVPKGQLRYTFDVERRQHHDTYSNLSEDDDIKNFMRCVDSVNGIAQSININIVHSFVPHFAKKTTAIKIQQCLKEKNINFIELFSNLDHARDGHHYDIVTSNHLVNEISKKLV
jgi:predicted regulator of amino acid metabolism with ACT domain